MSAAESLARFAGLLADRTRAAMCLALLDGRAWTAGELARHAGVAPSTASDHLTLLVGAGLLAEQRQGRHRYVRLADPETAQTVEDLAAIVSEVGQSSSLRTVRAAAQLAAARTCYDHIAGALGVALFDALVDAELIDQRRGLALTPTGHAWFSDLTGGPAVLGATGPRPLVRACLDWTERRSHLGGAVGALLCSELHVRGWLTRSSTNRSVALTSAGRDGLRGLVGLNMYLDGA